MSWLRNQMKLPKSPISFRSCKQARALASLGNMTPSGSGVAVVSTRRWRSSNTGKSVGKSATIQFFYNNVAEANDQPLDVRGHKF